VDEVGGNLADENGRALALAKKLPEQFAVAVKNLGRLERFPVAGGIQLGNAILDFLRQVGIDQRARHHHAAKNKHAPAAKCRQSEPGPGSQNSRVACGRAGQHTGPDAGVHFATSAQVPLDGWFGLYSWCLLKTVAGGWWSITSH
jgi:hypothetical protein